jgi:carboxymethylenebutenolidase
MDKIEIKTRDGLCPSYVFRPEGQGPWPGVLFFMDGPGIRPALFEMGERLAGAGYVVLMPDLFYRSGPYAPMDPKVVFSDPEKRKVVIEKYFGPANAANVMSDTGYFLDWLGASPEVKKGGVGVTGYCMGGRMALFAAGTYGERVAAMASYHGGNLAADQPDSPHLLAPKIKAKVYVAGAIEDQSFPDAQKQVLEEALTAAGVDHKIETYPAHHGWVPRDTAAYDEACSERHWATLLALYKSALK